VKSLKWVKRSKHKYNPFIPFKQQLAKVRGIDDIDEFLNPSSKNVHNPMLLKNIDKAKDRILQAIKNKEKISVAADVDPDGIISATIMVDFLRKATNNVSLVYHQRKDGHGIGADTVEEDTDLLIILDSSSNDVDDCEKLSETMDIVVIDHHKVEIKNPYVILVNPQQEGCQYPNKDLCAGLLAYKVIEVLNYEMQICNIEQYLDLVGISLVADVMPMDNLENRYFVKRGFEQINNIGLEALMDSLYIDKRNFNSTDISFKVVPSINAVTRMDKIELAFSLFQSNSYEKSVDIARQMIKFNEDRKQKEKELVETVEILNPEDKVIIALSENTSKNFNGLVATILARTYQRPALVGRKHSGYISGSYRTYGNFNIQEILQSIPHFKFALGHPGAGGFEFNEKDLDSIRKQLNEKLEDVTFDRVVEYDFDIPAEHVTFELLQETQEVNRITGRGFPEVRFKISNVFVEDLKVLGKNQDTVKIVSEGFELMKFKTDLKQFRDVTPFSTLDVVGSLNMNEWMGNKTLQVFVDDFIVT
jgi:single-stranded-DNA-specific exonuclease